LAVTAVAAFGALVWTRTAAAQTAEPAPPRAAKTSSLSWTRLEGAESCIGARELALAVERLLGRAVFVSTAKAELSVEGRVEARDGGAWHAVIVVADEQGQVLGTRELDSAEPDCRSLDDPVALAIALMIDPDAALAPTPPASGPPAPPPEVIVREKPVYVPVPVERPDEPAKPPADEEDPWRWAVRAGPVFGAGVMPGLGLGLTASATVEPPWFLPVEGGAILFFEREAESDGLRGAIDLMLAQGAVCPATLRGYGLVFSTCVEVQLGALWYEGLESAAGQEDTRFAFNLGARLRLDYRVIGPLTVGVGAAGAVPLLRDPIELDDSSGQPHEIYHQSPVVFLPDVHLGLEFP